MNAAAVLRVIVEAQTGPASASLAKFDGQLAATAANADKSMGRVAGSTAKAEAAAKRMQATGRTMAGVGKSIGLATAPLALFGAESVKMSLNFRRQMGLVATDAGGTAREVKKLEHSVLGLARTTQFGPQQLAESLFHVESSGYRGAKAMKVLNEAQKLATTGNSDLQTTTYALVSATKALYGESLTNVNRTAAELNGIVAHGDMRLEELTAAMSTGVIPKGKAMGLTLQDIGSAMDVMTARGIPAQRAAYALGFTLQKLVPYGEKAEEAFASIGLGEEELIKKAQNGKFGYVSALEDLQRHLDQLPTKAQQTKVIEEMFGGGRMTSGLLTNLQNLGEMRKIYRELGDEVSKYNRHIKEAEEQPLVKLKTAWSSIQADMTEIGGDLLPIIVPGFEHLVHLADGAMHGFAALPPELQSAAVEAGLIGIGLSGALIVTGKLITAIGTVREAMAGLDLMQASGALFGDLKAASTLALGGEMGGFRMLGADAAKALGGGLVAALPLAIAGAGLVNVAGSALHGDWEGVGYKAGGAVVGGIAGAFFGPEGAMVGAGIGSFIGGLLEPTKKLTPLQIQMAQSARAVARALGNEHDSAQGLKGAQGHLAEANERVHRTSQELRGAEKKLADVRKNGKEGSLELFHAETRVYESFRRQGEAIDHKRRALENLHFLEHQHGKSIGEVVHTSAVAISVEEKHIERLRERIRAEGGSKELTEKANAAFKRLAGYQSDYAEAIRQAKNRNVEWARSLEEMTPIQHRFGEQGRALNRVISDQKQKLGEIRQAVREASSEYSGIDLRQAEAKLRRLEHTAAHVNRSIVSHMTIGQKETAAAAFGMAKEVALSAGSMDTAVSSGLGILGENLNSALKGLGVGKKVTFDLKAIATTAIGLGSAYLGRQSGGIVPGNSSGDRHFRLLPEGSFVMNRNATEHFGFQNGGMVPTVLESRERVFYPHEVAAHGLGNLMMMNAAVPRQKGGSIGAEPQIAGPMGPLRSLGQAAVHQVYKGAQQYLRKHQPRAGGPIQLSGGLVASPFQFARYMIEAGFPRTVKVISEGLGTIMAESSFKPNSGQGPGGHIGPWAESPAFGSARVREDPKGSTFAAYRSPGWSVSHSFYPAWGRWEAEQSGADGAKKYGPQFAHVAAAALKRQRGGLVGRPQGFQGGGYVYPFQHANINWGRVDQGVDFTGTGPIQAIGSGSIAGVVPNWYEGQPYVYYKLNDGPKAGNYVYVAEGISGYPSVGTSFSAGDVIAHFAHGTVNDSIEMGWSTGSGSTSAQAAGDVASGSHYSSEGQDFYGFLKQLASGGGWSGKGETKAQEVAHTYKEPVPAEYHGCKAKQSLHFGSMPKTLQGVEKEIARRAKELGQYRRVAKLAAEKNRPAVAQALKHNVTALEGRLKQLRDERTKLRHEVVKKRFSRKLHRALSKVTGYEQLIEAKQRAYNIASQDIEQIVGLEPQEPILPASATEQQREAAEKNYLGAYESYLNGTERPAFQDILGKEADWRNTILRAEYFGFVGKGQPSVSDLEWHWEGRIYEVGTEIERINAYTERVKADLEAFHQRHHKHKAKALPDALKKEIAERDKKRAKLPTLRAQDTELRKVLGEGRALFYPGVKNGVPVNPPAPPLPGTGSFEDALIEVQGIHWPDQHSLIPSLPAQRAKGQFGGAIWDTQSSIEELGLKIQQAAAGIGGAGGGDSTGKTEREMLLEKLVNVKSQREAIEIALLPTLDQFKATYPFMGAFEKGGVALVGEAGPEIAHFPSGTRIHSADDTRQMLGSGPTTVVIERLHIDRDGKVTLDAKDPNVRAVVKQVIDDTRPPMSTPGSFSSGFRP